MEAEAPHTFLFADLAGFTALTEVHGDVDAAELVGDFVASARGLLGAHQSREVKTIGDALMVAGADAADAVRLGLRLAHEVGDCHGMPSVRVGMHTGSAVERDGDFIGAAVNIAARVSSIAAGGQVVLSDATKQASSSMDDVALHALGTRTFKNVSEPIAVFEAVWQSEASGREQLPIDPVCRMAVNPDHEVGRLTHSGIEFHFCSLKCAGAFSAEPDRYASR
ncbi:MAG: adenylate/guanylate cyclase domain-containing protein [Solirubrobacterales bacterium]